MGKRTINIMTIIQILLAMWATGSQAAAYSYTEDFSTTDARWGFLTTADWNTTDGELKLFPFAPSLVGSYNTSGVGVFVVGDLAYICEGSAGFHTIDISDPANPVLKSTYTTTASANDAYIDGNIAYVAGGSAGLHAIDITSPTTPLWLGTRNTPGFSYD
ncbi:MAG: hypothetical protein GY771_04160, partial [bacterium]|nr:hypothetical protein [bacterium]